MNYMFKGNDRVFHISSVFCQLHGTPERFKIRVLVGVLFGAMSGMDDRTTKQKMAR